MNPDHLAAAAAVLGGHQGIENAITREQMSIELGVHPRMVQKLVAELIDKHDQFIGSSPQVGYWMITDDEELELAAANLRPRALKILRRLSRLLKMSPRKLLKQLELDLQD